jgi:hypothetical protein
MSLPKVADMGTATVHVTIEQSDVVRYTRFLMQHAHRATVHHYRCQLTVGVRSICVGGREPPADMTSLVEHARFSAPLCNLVIEI